MTIDKKPLPTPSPAPLPETAGKILTSKGPGLTHLRKVRQVIASPLEIIERIWAEDGFVKIVEKGGKTRSMSPVQAKERIQQLKSMLQAARAGGMTVDDPLYKRTAVLIEKAALAANEAHHQHEDPSVSAATRAITMTMQGRRSTGEKFTLDNTNEDGNIKHFLMKFPTLTAPEIAAVLRHRSPMVFFRSVSRGESDHMILQRLGLHPNQLEAIDVIREKVMEALHRDNLRKRADAVASQADLVKPFATGP